jgi:NhaP-type Na+/H+ or K+/H+ antiporter
VLYRWQRLHLGVSVPWTTFNKPNYADNPSDWFRLKTEDDSFQPTIDMLLNVSIFAWYGAVCPWYSFAHNDVIPIYRLIFIGVLVLILRRLPIVLAMHKRIHQIEEWRQAFFVGFFGPMGVSAIFYLYTSREFLRQITYEGQERADVERLAEIFNVIVWFMVVCSVVRPSRSSILLLAP